MRPAILVLAASTIVAASAAAQSDTVFSWSRVPAGGRVTIRNNDGPIEFRAGTGDRIEVRARITAYRGGDPRDITFNVRDRDLGDLRVCTIVRGRDDCDPGGSNRDGRDGGNVRVSVSYVVTLPRGVQVAGATGNGDVTVTQSVASADLSTGNGDVSASDVAGAVSASSGNGDVSIKGATGTVRLSTGNGRVEFSGKPTRADVSSGNGDLRLTLPADFSAELDAQTGSGHVTCDFDLRMSGRLSSSRVHGYIGTANPGAPLVRVHSGSGDVLIKKG